MAEQIFRITVDSEDLFHCIPPGSVVPVRYAPRATPAGRQAVELTRDTLALFDRWLSRDLLSDQQTIRVIGSHLYALLFPEQYDEAFRKVLRAHEEGGSVDPLRVVIEFGADAGWLATLPWEFLFLPDDLESGAGFFLAARNNLVLTRHVKVTAREGEAQHSRRILVVVSEPRDQTMVSDAVVDEIRKLEARHPNGVEVQARVKEGSGIHKYGPTREDLRQWMADYRPDVLHFVGHGKYAEPAHGIESGQIAFVHPTTGDADWCSDRDLETILAPLPQLVFLHACEGARSRSFRGFKGLALKMVQLGVPNVVAMQYPVENNVATLFAAKFYECLGNRMQIDEAVQEGRRALGHALQLVSAGRKGRPEFFSDRRFGSPVAYVQAGHGLFLAKKEAEVVLEVKLRPCPYACGRDHRSDARFCDNGKGKLATCRKCRDLMIRDAVSCPNCGESGEGAAPRRAPDQFDTTVPARKANPFRSADAQRNVAHGSSGSSTQVGSSDV